MRTTIDIPEGLIKEAMRASQAKTKAMVIVVGLKELINRHKLEQLRALRGRIDLAVDLKKSRLR